jgi:tRNA A37 threonylcarbamoyladenosine modification protein TsaB
MKEKSKYKIYIDSSDRKITKTVLFEIEKNREIEVSKKEGQVDIVSSIEELLDNAHLSIDDIGVISYNPGPGSFIGLRMGAAVSNVLNWVLGKKEAKDLEYPRYGAEPNITPPKKFKLE